MKKKLLTLLLQELWEDAVFNIESYTILEKIVVRQSKQKNPEQLTSLPIEEIYKALSTTRNRNLISIKNQQKLQNTVVAFFGLSVGSHAAITWIMESRAKTIRISDPDVISATNLNRLKIGWKHIGRLKTEVVKEELLSIHPFCKVVTSNHQAIDQFLNQSPTTQIIVDAIDDMEGKVALRMFAKKHKIPLLSAADVGDNVVLDIERYDIHPQPKPFLGRIPEELYQSFASLSDQERRRLIIQLVGFEENSLEMLDSLLSIGKSTATWPQLGATATMAGGILTTTIKKIVLGEKVISGRYYISLDSLLISPFHTIHEVTKKQKTIERVKEKFAL